jgi:hypothetical protein
MIKLTKAQQKALDSLESQSWILEKVKKLKDSDGKIEARLERQRKVFYLDECPHAIDGIWLEKVEVLISRLGTETVPKYGYTSAFLGPYCMYPKDRGGRLHDRKKGLAVQLNIWGGVAISVEEKV